MKGSYRIARVAGIDVKIHVTFLLLLAWFGWMYWQERGVSGAIEGVGFTLLLFLCVLLHEFGHAFAARAYGIRTPDITLLPIGGVARLERMPSKPAHELVVAIAGPAVNVVIAALLAFFLAFKVRATDFSDIDHVGGSLAAKLFYVNVMLVAFNAIPAFPMDGGRVLRALLAMRFSNVLATTIAARVGQTIAVGFAAASFLGAPMLLFIAIFVFLGAQQELAYARSRGGGPKKISDIMHSQFSSIPADTPLDHAIAFVRESSQPFFPVVDAGLRALGVVTLDSLEQAAAVGVSRPVSQVAVPAVRVQSSAPIDSLLASASPGTPVVAENPSGQIVGVIAFRA